MEAIGAPVIVIYTIGGTDGQWYYSKDSGGTGS